MLDIEFVAAIQTVGALHIVGGGVGVLDVILLVEAILQLMRQHRSTLRRGLLHRCGHCPR